MARYVAKVRTSRSAEEAFAYMADLTNFAEWDPGVVRTEVVDGVELDPPREVDVTVQGFRGDMTLRYKIGQYEPPRRVVAQADTRFLRSLDIILVEPSDDGCVVTYDAELTLKGPLGLADRWLQSTFDRIGAKAGDGMATALEGTLVEA